MRSSRSDDTTPILSCGPDRATDSVIEDLEREFLIADNAPLENQIDYSPY